jgi:hypothetical protein
MKHQTFKRGNMLETAARGRGLVHVFVSTFATIRAKEGFFYHCGVIHFFARSSLDAIGLDAIHTFLAAIF